MTIPSFIYPLDLTGTSPANLVQGEVHKVPVQQVRAIATTFGPYFKDSMQVVDSSTGRKLTPGRDFFATELLVIPTGQTGKDVCSIVIVTDTTASATLSLTYQVIGGRYSDSDESLAAFLNSIDFSKRSPSWPSPIVKAEDVSEMERSFGQGSRFGFEYAVQALERIRSAIAEDRLIVNDAFFNYLEANVGKVTPDFALRLQYALQSSMGVHLKAANPHPQYFLRADVQSLPKVRQPTNISPANGTTGASVFSTLTANAYAALYRLPQGSAEFQVATDAGFASPVISNAINGAVTSYTPGDVLQANTKYYWRVRYSNNEGNFSAWSVPTYFTTLAGNVIQPSVTGPADGATSQPLTPTITSSSFTCIGGPDSHGSSDWEIWTGPNGSGTKVFSSYSDTTNKTSIAVPAGKLPDGTKLYPRVRYRGAKLPVSAWSLAVSFTTARTGVNTPSITTPSNGSINIAPTGSLTSSAFATTNVADTHASSDWEIWTGPNGTGTKVFGSYANTSNKTTITPNGLTWSTTYYARVRYNGATLGASAWSADDSFTTKAQPPAAGTVLDSKCTGYDLYNQVADGSGGSNWTLAQSNSPSCGYTIPFVVKPTITGPTSGSTFGDWYAVNAINFSNTAFQMGGTNPSDSWASTDYQLLNAAGTAVVKSFSVQAASYLSSTFGNLVLDANSGVADNTSYLVRMRHTSTKGLISAWSDAITIKVDFTDAGTYIKAQCYGVDKYAIRADGKGGQYKAELLQANSTDCGYTPPTNYPAPIQPWTSKTFTGTTTSGNANAQFELAYGYISGATGPTGNSETGTWLPQGAANTDYELLWTSSGSSLTVTGSTPAGQWGPCSAAATLTGTSGTTTVNFTIRHKLDNSKAVSFTVILVVQTNAPASTFTSATLDNLILNNTTTSATAQESLYLNTDGTWTFDWMGGTHYQSKPDGRWTDTGQNAANFEISVSVVQDQLDNGYITYAGGDPGTGYYNLGGGWRMTLSDSSGTNSAGSSYEVKLNIRNKLTGEVYVADVTMHAQSGCFAVGTVLRTPSGDVKVEDLKAGDVVSSFAVPTMVDESEENWLDWKTTSIEGFDSTTTAVVKGVAQFTADQSIKVNGIHSTLNHIYFVFDGVKYGWMRADTLVLTDMFLDDKGNLVPITSIELVNEPSTFVVVDVETLDTLQVKSGDIYLMSHNATYAL